MKGRSTILPTPLRQSMRSHPTQAEHVLWQHLRQRQMSGCKFRRQHPFNDYVLDFVCLERSLAVELDGGQHASQVDRDIQRDDALTRAGFRVLRFWNNEVLDNTEAVLNVILAALGDEPHPLPSPPIEGEGASSHAIEADAVGQRNTAPNHNCGTAVAENPASPRLAVPPPPLHGEGRGGDGVAHPQNGFREV